MRKIMAIVSLLISSQLPAEWLGVFDLSVSSNADPGIGLGTYQIRSGKPGFYLNMVLPIDRFYEYPNLDVNSFSDPVTSYYQKVFGINLGVTLPVGSSLLLYAGGGPGFIAGMANMSDADRILSPFGNYQVPYPENDDFQWNLNGGILYNTGRISLHAGYHQFYQGIVLGIGSGF